MPSPATTLATLRTDLATYLELRLPSIASGYIARMLFPVIEVAKQSSTFGKIVLEEMLRKAIDLRRAPGSGYWRSVTQFTKDTYATEERGVEEPVDRREAAMYRDYINAEEFAMERAVHTILEDFERRVAAILFSTTYSGDAALSNAAAAPWNGGSATIRADIRLARQDFFANTGMYPNTLIMNRKVFEAARLEADITNTIASAGAGDSIKTSQLTESQFAQAVGVDQVLVAGAPQNTAAFGAAATISHIWGDYAMLLKVAETQDMREPCIGRTMHWAEDGSSFLGTVESYYDEATRSDIVRVRHDTDEKLLHTECGFMITTVYS